MALAAIFSFTLVAPLGVPWWVPLVAFAAVAAVLWGMQRVARNRRTGIWRGIAVLRETKGSGRIVALVCLAVVIQIARNWLLLNWSGVDASVFDSTALLIGLAVVGLLPVGPSLGAATAVLILGTNGVAASAAAGALLTATAAAGALCFASWALVDRLWLQRTPVVRRPAPAETPVVAPPGPGRLAGVAPAGLVQRRASGRPPRLHPEADASLLHRFDRGVAGLGDPAVLILGAALHLELDPRARLDLATALGRGVLVEPDQCGLPGPLAAAGQAVELVALPDPGPRQLRAFHVGHPADGHLAALAGPIGRGLNRRLGHLAPPS